MRYRKKPVVVDAIVFDPRNLPPMVQPEYVTGSPMGRDDGHPTGRYLIETLEGPHVVSPGDYIIRGVKGEFYPCKPDIFAMTYDVADDQEEAFAFYPSVDDDEVAITEA